MTPLHMPEHTSSRSRVDRLSDIWEVRRLVHKPQRRERRSVELAAPSDIEEWIFVFGVENDKEPSSHPSFFLFGTILVSLSFRKKPQTLDDFASGSKTVPTKYLFLGFIMFIVVFRPGGHVHPHCLGTYLTHARTLKAFVFKVLRNALNVATYFTHARTLKAFVFKVLRNGLPRYILYTCPNLM